MILAVWDSWAKRMKSKQRDVETKHKERMKKNRMSQIQGKIYRPDDFGISASSHKCN